MKGAHDVFPQTGTVFPQLSTGRSIAIILLCLAIFILSNMSQMAIKVMLPSIKQDIKMDKFDVQYITSSYTLSYGSTLMLAGRLSDVYGHKLCLMIGLALFAAFTVPSAMARSSLELAIYRALQGLGASAISPPLFAILARSFKHGTTMRTEGFATLSAGSPLGSSVGLFLGGWLTEFTGPGWKTFFYFSLAFSVCAIVCAWIILPPDPPPTTKKGFKDVDWIGATLLVTGLTVLVATLSFNTRFGWNSPQMYIPFLSSQLIVGAFFAWEFFFERKWSRQPLLPLSLFRKRYFAAIQCVAGLLYMAYTDHSYFVLQYFQKYHHLSLDDTLVRMLPILIVGLGLNLVTGHFAHILPAQLMIIVGCLSTTTACALSSIMDPAASYWAYNFFAIGLSVVGADFVFSVGAMFGSNIADDDEQAIAGAVILSSTRVISAVGLGMATIAQTEVVKESKKSLLSGLHTETHGSHDDHLTQPAYMDGLRVSFFACLACVFLATLIAITCLWGMGYVCAHDHGNHSKAVRTSNMTSKDDSKLSV